MSFLDDLFGGKPPRYTPQRTLYGGGGGRTAQADFSALRALLNSMVAGDNPFTDAQIIELLSPAIRNAASGAEANRQRINERGASLAHLGGSGMLMRSQNENDRAQSEQVANASTDLRNLIANAILSRQQYGSGALGALLSEDQAMRSSEATKQWNASAARAGASSGLGNSIKFGAALAATILTGGAAAPAMGAVAGGNGPAAQLQDQFGSYYRNNFNAASPANTGTATYNIPFTNPATYDPYRGLGASNSYSGFGNYVGLPTGDTGRSSLRDFWGVGR